jgi:hypothetical protein
MVPAARLFAELLYGFGIKYNLLSLLQKMFRRCSLNMLMFHLHNQVQKPESKIFDQEF